jgi:hypothetical protein
MTATQQEFQEAPQVPPQPPPQRRRSRTLPVVVGAALATVGSVVALAGGGVLVAAGSDGTVGSGGSHQVSTPTQAVVTSAATIDDTDAISSVLGQPRIGVRATSQDGRDVFVGVGRRADVDRYLRGVSVDRVTEFGVAPYRFGTRREGSATAKAGAPTRQRFWVAQSSGHTADLHWKVRDGDYRVVVMNADASRGVATDSHFEVGAPYLSTLGLTLVLVGAVALGSGIVVLVRPGQDRR